MEELAAIAADPQLRQLADNPKVTVEQVLDVITGVARSALPDAARNFLRVIIENGRLDALPEVAVQFRGIVNRLNGSSDAIVYSAFPVEDAALNDIERCAAKAFRPQAESVRQDRCIFDWRCSCGGGRRGAGHLR